MPAFAALFFVCQSLSSFGQQTVEVTTKDYRFQPQEIRIQIGDTVKWVNREKRTSHSIEFSDGSKSASDRMFPDESWQRRFDSTGTYTYQCGPHPEMTGKVIVEAPKPLAACIPATSNHDWNVTVGQDNSSIEITHAKGAPKRLSLRPNLLPEVHFLRNSDHALMATRDGWIMRLDLKQGKQVAETKLNALVSSTALSAPQRDRVQLLAIASENPGTLTLVDETLTQLKTIPVVDKTGRIASGITRVRTAKARESFIALLNNVPELWEVSYNPKAPEIGLGMVHDFQYREGHFVPGYLNPQRITLPSLAQDVVLLDSDHEVLTVHQTAKKMGDSSHAQLFVTHLDVRKTQMGSTPSFTPLRTGQDWLQVAPETLPQNPSTRELTLHPSTLRFIEAPRNAVTQKDNPNFSHPICPI